MYNKIYNTSKISQKPFMKFNFSNTFFFFFFQYFIFMSQYKLQMKNIVLYKTMKKLKKKKISKEALTSRNQVVVDLQFWDPEV